MEWMLRRAGPLPRAEPTGERMNAGLPEVSNRDTV